MSRKPHDGKSKQTGSQFQFCRFASSTSNDVIKSEKAQKGKTYIRI